MNTERKYRLIEYIIGTQLFKLKDVLKFIKIIDPELIKSEIHTKKISIKVTELSINKDELTFEFDFNGSKFYRTESISGTWDKVKSKFFDRYQLYEINKIDSVRKFDDDWTDLMNLMGYNI